MKFSTIFLGALAAFTVSAIGVVGVGQPEHAAVATVTATQTVTKYKPTTTTITETETVAKVSKTTVTETVSLTKTSKVKVVVTETATYTKTHKTCPTVSPTQSAQPIAKRGRSFGAQPLYADQFA